MTKKVTVSTHGFETLGQCAIAIERVIQALENSDLDEPSGQLNDLHYCRISAILMYLFEFEGLINSILHQFEENEQIEEVKKEKDRRTLKEKIKEIHKHAGKDPKKYCGGKTFQELHKLFEIRDELVHPKYTLREKHFVTEGLNLSVEEHFECLAGDLIIFADKQQFIKSKKIIKDAAQQLNRNCFCVDSLFSYVMY
ncbi:MAG: hypothetical protein ACRDCT_13865 [Shewanella sp.]